MKKFWLGIVGLAAASTANAAVVTYTLSINDDGFGTPTPGAFAVYADASAGDNAGLFAFGVDLVDGSVDSIANMSPNWLYRKTTSPTGPNRFAGFGTGVAEDGPSGKISGVTDLAKGTALLPVYGYAQRDIDMNAVPPAGPRPSVGGVQYNQSTDSNPNSPGPLVAAHMLLGNGFFSSHLPAWQTSVDNAASTYDNPNGGASGTANTAALVKLNTINLIAPSADSLVVANAAVGANQAVGGFIAVTGSNNRYSSEVDQLLDPSQNKASANVQTIGDESGFLWVMAKIIGADVPAIQADANINNGQTADAATAAQLHALYDSQFGGGGFNLLYRQSNITGPKNVNWDFSGHASVLVDQMAVVPEPASMGLIALAGLGLLARRRRVHA